jgi:hypothetical protein
VTHLPGTRNPTDPLSRRGFADGDGPAASTGDTVVESQQELFSRLGRDAPASAMLDAVRAGRRVRRSGTCSRCWLRLRRVSAAAPIQSQIAYC